jgi:flagellar hook-associated protein 3 FlgL
VAGRSVFAGYLTDQPAFQAGGVYQGDQGELQLEVAPGLRVAATLRGDEVFSGAGGGVDLFVALDGLADALEANDTAGIRASLTDLDGGLEQINHSRARLGAGLDSLELAQAWCARVSENTQVDRARLRDSDLSKVTMELALARQALEAAMATVPKLTSLSLLDRL